MAGLYFVNELCVWLFISCLDARNEPKKLQMRNSLRSASTSKLAAALTQTEFSRLHFVGGLFPSFTKASELASLKQADAS